VKGEEGKVLSSNSGDHNCDGSKKPSEMLTVSTSFLIDGSNNDQITPNTANSNSNMNGLVESSKTETIDAQLNSNSDGGNFIKLHYDIDDFQNTSTSESNMFGTMKSVKCSSCHKLESKKFLVS